MNYSNYRCGTGIIWYQLLQVFGVLGTVPQSRPRIGDILGVFQLQVCLSKPDSCETTKVA